MSTTDPLKPSCGSGFEETSSGYSDMTDLARGSLLGFGESQAGGNMITDRDPRTTGALGTPSEQTNVDSPFTPPGGNHVPDPAAAGDHDDYTHGV